ncbi:unnamed protein product [Adineta ricciae]|uniref:Ferric-chelate reductase 1 n=1 Tax=Adineta ricciae TaxID=249248 RepID=A0A814YTW3_ADIRI|nr:unnamed protein product [Adineta ricciae]
MLFNYSIDEPIHIFIKTTTLDTPFHGVHVVALDENQLQVGSWEINTKKQDENSCNGSIYIFEKAVTNTDAIWQVSSPVVGNIAIKVVIIEDDSAIYSNCYNFILTSRVSMNSSNIDEEDAAAINTTTTVTTTTTTVTTPPPTSEVTVNITWSFASNTNVTSVLMTIHNLKTSQWVAIGLGQNIAMGEAHVFMCKRLANNEIVINRYVNPGDHDPPEPPQPDAGGVFTPGQQQFTDGVVICRFTLSNFIAQTLKQVRTLEPLSQFRQYHPLIAIGVLDKDNNAQKHSRDSRVAKSDTVQLNQNEIILYRIPEVKTDLTFVRTHGIIMIFTWILIVSTGALISRYFKTSWANKMICGKAAWFTAHRFLMSIAAILTTLGFLFILVFLQGTWIPNDTTRPYAHSITGIIVIGLAFFQPFIALFRCEPNTFILSVATLYLATYFHVFADTKGRFVMIAWIVWVALIFLIFECSEYFIRKKNRESGYTNINASNTTVADLIENPTTPKFTSFTVDNHEETSVQQKAKNILLAIHILVAATLSVILTTLIL